MRIDLFLLMVICVVSVIFGSCVKKVKKLEQKIKKLEKRVAAIEKGLCSRQDCPVGFVRHKNDCLLFVIVNKKNWEKSRKDCQRRGADLVTINSRRKEKFIARYIHQHFPVGKHNMQLYTGLIMSDEQTASTPFEHKVTVPKTEDDYQQLPPHSSLTSIRWVSTNRAIKTKTLYSSRPPFVKWSPKRLKSVYEGAKGRHDCFDQNCVTVSLGKKFMESSKSKLQLTWSYGCSRSKLSYICETKRLHRIKCD